MRTLCLPRPVSRIFAILSLSLVLLGLVAPAVSAGDNGGDVAVDSRMDMLVKACIAAGGTPEVEYEFGIDGHVEIARIKCTNQTGSWGDSWNCTVFTDGDVWCARTVLPDSQWDDVVPDPETVVDQELTLVDVIEVNPTLVDATVEQATEVGVVDSSSADSQTGTIRPIDSGRAVASTESDPSLDSSEFDDPARERGQQ